MVEKIHDLQWPLVELVEIEFTWKSHLKEGKSNLLSLCISLQTNSATTYVYTYRFWHGNIDKIKK